LFGLNPPPVENCRVLEIGCSTGGHLLAAALTLPNARFVGIDISESQLQIGRTVAAAAGITNVEFRSADLMTFRPDPGSFDYATAHAVYSWVPTNVRDRLLAVAKEALAPNGLGFMSYNAYPGGHIREMFWNMFRFHSADTTDPAEKISRVYGLAEFLVAGQTEPNGLAAQLMRGEAKRLEKIPFPGLIHYDDLWDGNTPVYVTEFARHLAKHSLKYVAEADVPKMHEGRFPPTVAEKLAAIRVTDLVRKEQYIDFLMLRRYRLSVFSHTDANPATSAHSAAIPEFHVGLTGRPVFEARFEQAVIDELKERSPQHIPFAELLSRSLARVGKEKARIYSARFADFLLDLFLRGFMEFSAMSSPFAKSPGPNPKASPLARVMSLESVWIPTLSMQTFHASEPGARELLSLLDGTRNRETLANDLVRAVPDLSDAKAATERLLDKFTEAGLLMS
jgi:SAM-dependent methyltransferase